MAEPLKNIYNQSFFDRFISGLQEVVPAFDKASFLRYIYDDQWESLELKQRMRHITLGLKAHFQGDYKQNVDTLLKAIPFLLQHGFSNDNLEFIIFPDFIEVYGIDDYDTSIKAFEQLTIFVTCEFAVRPFLLQYEQPMMAQLLIWSKHKHPSVRRFASEGCRPRLPWAMGIPSLKKDPSAIFPIIENLKHDPSEYVRRSVANNLNDISKDHPETVIAITKRWKGHHSNTDKLVKHACRTLLKQGNPEVMRLFGYGSIDQIQITDFQILTPKVSIGGFVEFNFNLLNNSHSEILIRLEYGLYFQKANGTLSRKVFKISEKIYAAHSNTNIIRKQSFRVITTRKLHIGKHQVAIIVNGIEFEKHDFELI